MKWISGGVTAALGFRASGVSAGIKRNRKPDLALIAADRPVAAAGVFTTNRLQAAPVQISKTRLRAGRTQAVLINSGCANCLTGPAGTRDALAISRTMAGLLGIAERDVLLASTGIIGHRLPVVKVTRALPALIRQLSRRHHEAAAQAILTTDLHPKEAAVEAVVGGRSVRVGGMAKGAGMIAPSMATMLCVLTTDAAASPSWLRAVLARAVGRSFNHISVDGDMSTNDTVFALASGDAGVAIRPGTRAAETVAAMVEAVAGRLAVLLVQDGEGAEKLMEVEVVGARTEQDARACARQIACSPLVKTMLAGSDPNVGRLAAAAGASPARFHPDRLEIHLEGVRMVADGAALPVAAFVMRRLLTRPQVHVRINLHAGTAAARMLTCDLTEEYVRINAGYAT